MSHAAFDRSTRLLATLLLAGSALAGSAAGPAAGDSSHGPAVAAVPTDASAALTEAEVRVAALDEAAIRATVQRYFDGMMEGSAAKLAEAFDENALLIGTARNGTALQRIPFARWSQSWEGRTVSNRAAYRNRVTDVHFTGDAAMVRTVLEWPGVKYTDYLSLLRIDGEWKIVNKIWTEERR